MEIGSALNFIPENDALRLEKLKEYQILDTHSEDTFDKVALLARQIFNTPDAFITFVDENRVFFKSNLSSLPTNEIPREDSLDSLTILNDGLTLYTDTHEHPELMHMPLVSIEGGIRFYAGFPLKSPEGYNIGTVCVIDSQPREATQEQIDMLYTLSRIIVDKLENKLRYRKNVKAQIDLMNIALHEIKNPIASINLANDIIRKDPTKAERMTDMIKSSVQSIQGKLSDLLKQSELEEKELVLNIEGLDMKDVFARLNANFELLAQRKKQTLYFNCDNTPTVFADRMKLNDILHNLVSNAIKYSYEGATITVIAKQSGSDIRIEVIDEGQGLDQDDLSRLFTKFAKLSSKPTGKETSNGLGLSITKSMVELHNGSIEAISAGKNKGTSFIVTLPLNHEPVNEGMF